MKKTVTVLLGIVLAGCGTMTKPEMSEKDQYQSGEMLAATIFCVSDGHMTKEDATTVHTVIQSALANYKVDQATVDSGYHKALNSGVRPTKDYCTTLALTMQSRMAQHQQAVANRNAAIQGLEDSLNNFNRNRPTTTFCNRIGSMVSCNSY